MPIPRDWTAKIQTDFVTEIFCNSLSIFLYVVYGIWFWLGLIDDSNEIFASLIQKESSQLALHEFDPPHIPRSIQNISC